MVTGMGLACAWLWAAPYRFEDHERASSAPSSYEAPAVAQAAEAQADAGATGADASTPVTALVAQKARTPSLANTRNLLLVGLDRRPDGSGPGLTDSLVVVVLDERSAHVGLISIPRDLYVDIPEAGTDRINTVYGVAKRSKRNGLELLRRVVEDTLQLPIQHALALDLGVFERAVDAVGGVEVDVPCALLDRFIDPRMEDGRRTLDVDPGRVHMDGVTAAMYARSRHGRSDFDRARRQQAILLGVQHALTGMGIAKFPDLWSELEASIETDLRRIELFSLARRALRIQPSHLHGLVLSPPYTRGVHTPEGKSVLLADYEAIDGALGKLFSEPSPGAEPKLGKCAAKDAALQESAAAPARSANVVVSAEVPSRARPAASVVDPPEPSQPEEAVAR